MDYHVGGNGRFSDPAAHSEFLACLGTHCRESAAVVRDFAKGWLAKAVSDEDVTRERASRFVAHAFKKLRKEIRQRGERCDPAVPGAREAGDGK